jgi:hypothetical protein
MGRSGPELNEIWHQPKTTVAPKPTRASLFSTLAGYPFFSLNFITTFDMKSASRKACKKRIRAAVKRHQTPALATISFRLKKRKGKRWSVAKQKEASMRIHDRSIHAVVAERDADSSSALNYLLITLSIIVPHFAPDLWGFGRVTTVSGLFFLGPQCLAGTGIVSPVIMASFDAWAKRVGRNFVLLSNQNTRVGCGSTRVYLGLL